MRARDHGSVIRSLFPGLIARRTQPAFAGQLTQCIRCITVDQHLYIVKRRIGFAIGINAALVIDTRAQVYPSAIY